MPEEQVHNAQWQESSDGQQFDLRIEITNGGQVKFSNLNDPDYSQTCESLDEATSVFEKLMRQGTKGTGASAR